MRIALAVLALVAVAPGLAIEIAAGSMLGPRYKQDRFYVRSSRGARWTQTYEGGAYQRSVRGSLAMLRLPQALFDDEWLTERKFDSTANLERLIDALDLYKQHGVAGVVVSLQGGDPGYSEANGIGRGGSADLGEKAGALISAYNADGSLKPEWMARLDKLLIEADRRRMVVVLVYFQQYQDEVLESPRAVVAAARNITRHLIERDTRNVIIDIADAWDEPRDSWDHRRFIARNIANLVRAVRGEFQHAEFSLPIGASTGSGMLYPASLARVCDVVLLQGNGSSAAQKRARSRQLKEYGRPVLMVSDDNGPAAARAELSDERSAAEAFLVNASGWSYLPTAMARSFPFEYAPAETAMFEDSWENSRRRPAYFRAVLEQIARLVLRKPPSTVPRNSKNPK